MSKDNLTQDLPVTLIQDPDTETVTLETPIVRGEQVINTITIRKPKTGALRGLALSDVMKLEVDAMSKLIPRVTTPTIVEHEVSNLDLPDFINISSAVVGFFASTAEREKIKQQDFQTA